MKITMVAALLLAMPLGAEHYVRESKPTIAVASEPTVLVGVASYYGEEWTTGHAHRGIMANGKPFNPRKLTAASYALPLGTKVKVTNLTNGRVVTVVITDRGPNHRLHRLIDLSEAAAKQLDYTHQGLTMVSVQR